MEKMMLLRVNCVGDGPGPSEVVVEVATAGGGLAEMIVDRRTLSDQKVEIGYPISQRDGQLLVELPRESVSGFWRVWVDNDQVSPS
jgi:hypothetical protein